MDLPLNMLSIPAPRSVTRLHELMGKSLALCDACIMLAEHISNVTAKEAMRPYCHMGDSQMLIKSAESCKFCALVMKEFTRDGSNMADIFTSSRRIEIGFVRGTKGFHGIEMDEPQICRLVILVCPRSQLDFIPTYSCEPVILDVSTSRDDPSFGQIVGVDSLPDSGSPQAMRFITNLFQECLSEHAECRLSLSGQYISHVAELPTRILKLDPTGKTDHVQLLITRGQRDRYAALSYCWGPENQHPLETTKKTMEKYLGKIPTNSLPKTFKHAIDATKALGLGYLWIDSLCIIQDDAEDWNREASKMRLVYRNAAVVVAATDSKSAHDGLFYRQEPLDSIMLPYLSKSLLHPHQYTFRVSPLDPQECISLAESCLGDRAWATQEWALARRIIHFRRSGISWTCRSFDDGIKWNGRTELVDYAYHTHYSWESVLVWYSTRGLTFSKDRLAAIKGLADEIQDINPRNKYVFGLWTENLPSQLLWLSDSSNKPITELSGLVPSWSWSSIEGGISFPLNPFYDNHCEFVCSRVQVEGLKLSIQSRVKPLPSRECFSFHYGDREEEMCNSLFTKANLSITAHIEDRKNKHCKAGHESIHYALIDGEQNVYGWAIFDNNTIPPGTISCLQLCRINEHLGGCHGMLLVQESLNGHGLNKRVGVGFVFLNNWFDDVNEHIITIH